MGGTERRFGRSGKCRLAYLAGCGKVLTGFIVSRLPVLGPMFMTDLECLPVMGGFEFGSTRA